MIQGAFRRYAATLLGGQSGDRRQDMPLPTHPVVHLPIDVQERYVDTLRADRREDYPRRIHEFRNALRECDVPTIHVGYGDIGGGRKRERNDIKHVARCSPWRMPCPEFREELSDFAKDRKLLVLPYKDEDVIVKCFDDAFQKKSVADCGLADLLKRYGVKTVIMTGGNTTACVLSSAVGALAAGFNLLIVYDRLADKWSPEQESSPFWHKEKLWDISDEGFAAWSGISRPRASVRLVTAAECLALVARQNGQPEPPRPIAQSPLQPVLR